MKMAGDDVSQRSTMASVAGEPKKKRKKREPLAMSPTAHDCSVLAVDPAELSGFSAWDRGNLKWYGECDVFGDEPQRVIERFLSTMPGPHVIVIERPFMMRFGNQSSLATGAKIWSKRAERMRFGKRIVRVYPSSWRSKMLRRGMASAKRAVVRPEERAEAKKIVELHFGPEMATVLPVAAESAPAILIGRWGSFAGEVLAVLPKPRVQKVVDATCVKLGRFAMRSKATKRIERATDGAQHVIGTWLVVDGKVAKRGDVLTQERLETAEVQLGFDTMEHEGEHEGQSWSRTVRFTTRVPFSASSAQIEAGWNVVAAQVELAHKGRAA